MHWTHHIEHQTSRKIEQVVNINNFTRADADRSLNEIHYQTMDLSRIGVQQCSKQTIINLTTE